MERTKADVVCTAYRFSKVLRTYFRYTLFYIPWRKDPCFIRYATVKMGPHLVIWTELNLTEWIGVLTVDRLPT